MVVGLRLLKVGKGWEYKYYSAGPFQESAAHRRSCHQSTRYQIFGFLPSLDGRLLVIHLENLYLGRGKSRHEDDDYG